MKDRNPSNTKIGVTPQTKDRFDSFASRYRLSLVQAADVAISAVEQLTSDQIAQLITARPTVQPKAR